jgi:hypothetical protein
MRQISLEERLRLPSADLPLRAICRGIRVTFRRKIEIRATEARVSSP